MLRRSRAHCLCVLLPVLGCEGIVSPAGTGTTLFEVEHFNYAWVPTWRGFVIDSTGAIRSYDLQGKRWQPSNPDYPTATELWTKYGSEPKPAGSIDPATFRAMQERADRAAAAPLSHAVSRCADAGITTYSAWRYDAEQNAYRRILLWQEGDVARRSQSADGQEVAEWLRSLRLLVDLQRCQP